jgi:hypothetical protein
MKILMDEKTGLINVLCDQSALRTKMETLAL